MIYYIFALFAGQIAILQFTVFLTLYTSSQFEIFDLLAKLWRLTCRTFVSNLTAADVRLKRSFRGAEVSVLCNIFLLVMS